MTPEQIKEARGLLANDEWLDEVPLAYSLITTLSPGARRALDELLPIALDEIERLQNLLGAEGQGEGDLNEIIRRKEEQIDALRMERDEARALYKETEEKLSRLQLPSALEEALERCGDLRNERDAARAALRIYESEGRK